MKKILHLALACVALLSLMPHPALFAPAATSTVVVPEFNKNRHILAHVALFAALHLAQIGYNGMLHLRQGYGGQATPATKNPANRTLKQRAAQAAANTKAFLKALATLQSYKNYGAELKAILPTPTKTGTKLSAKQWAQAVLAGTKIFIKNHQIVSLGLPLQFILGGGYTWLTRNAHLAGLAERAADQARLNAEFEKQEKDRLAKEAAEAERLAKEAAEAKLKKAKAQLKQTNLFNKKIRNIKAASATTRAQIRQEQQKLNKIKNSAVAKKLKWAGLKRKTISAIKAKRELDLDKRRREKTRELFERDDMRNEDSRTEDRERVALTTNFNVLKGYVNATTKLKKKLKEIRSKKAAPTPTPPQSGEEDGDGEEDAADDGSGEGPGGEEEGDDADNNSGSDTPVHTPKPAEVPEPDDVPPVTPPKPSPAKVRVIPGFALSEDDSETEGTIVYAQPPAKDGADQEPCYLIKQGTGWSRFTVPTDASKELTKRLASAKKQFEAYASFGDVHEAFDPSTCEAEDLCVHDGQYFEVVASGASKKAINGLIQKQITDKDKLAAAQALYQAWQAKIAAEREKQAAAQQKPAKRFWFF